MLVECIFIFFSHHEAVAAAAAAPPSTTTPHLPLCPSSAVGVVPSSLTLFGLVGDYLVNARTILAAICRKKIEAMNESERTTTTNGSLLNQLKLPTSSIQHPVRRNPPFHLCARFADYYAQSRDRHPYRAIALWRDEAITPNCAPIDSQRCSTAPFCSALRHHDSEPNLHFKSGLSRIGIQLQHGITTSSGTCRSGGRRSRGSLRPSSVRVSIRSHPERAIAGVPPSPAPSSM